MMLPIIEFWIWKNDPQVGQFKEPSTGIVLHWYENETVIVMDCKTKVIHKVSLNKDTKVLGFRQSMEMFDGQP